MVDDDGYDYELYITELGIKSISSNVKMAILSELSKGDLSLTELSSRVKKAQSTLSVHLDKMVEDKLISVRVDPNDSRRKYYSLTSYCIAYSKKPSEDSADLMLKLMESVSTNPEYAVRALPAAMFLGLDAAGLYTGPIASAVGMFHGFGMASATAGMEQNEAIAYILDYYNRMGLGEVTMFSNNPLTLIIKMKAPFTETSSESIGGYAMAFFTQVMENITGKPYEITSKEIFGSDYNYYRFTLEQASRKQPVLSAAQFIRK